MTLFDARRSHSMTYHFGARYVCDKWRTRRRRARHTEISVSSSCHCAPSLLCPIDWDAMPHCQSAPMTCTIWYPKKSACCFAGHHSNAKCCCTAQKR